MAPFDTNSIAPDAAATIALAALVWMLDDPVRASRLLCMTGLDPRDLRARAGESLVLAAILRFLEAFEPDLIACADAMSEKPERLVAARKVLET